MLFVDVINFLLRSRWGAKYCDQLYVCSHIPKPHVQISRNFPYMLHVAVARSSSDDCAIRYVLPVLWMMSFFT